MQNDLIIWNLALTTLLLISTSGAYAENNLRFPSNVDANIITNEDTQNDEWVPFLIYDKEPLVTDEKWLELVANMTEGVKVVSTATGNEIFHSKELLTREDLCSNIYDLTSLQPDFKNYQSWTVLYRYEQSGCGGTGMDYTYTAIRNVYGRLYYNHRDTGVNYSAIPYDVSSEVIFYIK